VRRRTARVIADWVARVEEGDRPTVYRALLGLLGESDMCMQVGAELWVWEHKRTSCSASSVGGHQGRSHAGRQIGVLGDTSRALLTSNLLLAAAHP
jgi:hypothetical protein